MRVSLLIPCFNEETSLDVSIRSCLNQTRPVDEIIYIDDGSTDRTPHILDQYRDRVFVHRTPKNTGNKSSAQEYGLQFVTGDIMITTDADTLMAPNFTEEILKSFEDPEVVAVAGHVQSIPHNWLTLCRAFDYAIGQYIHKRAQDHLGYIFIMPGAASAFRTDMFRKYVTFDHDTITEDLDFTYKLHLQGLRIRYNPKAITRTQDPADLSSYTKQMRRWFGGGWQNLMKHYRIVVSTPIRALELSLGYAEGIIFSALLFLIPVLNPLLWVKILASYCVVTSLLAIWVAYKERRPAIALVAFPYLILMYVHAYVYLEQFVLEVLLKRKNLVWFKPERFDMSTL